MTHQTDERTIGMILERVESVSSAVGNLDKKMDDLVIKFVSKEEFFPVKSIVYGATGLALIAVATLIINNAIKTTSKSEKESLPLVRNK